MIVSFASPFTLGAKVWRLRRQTTGFRETPRSSLSVLPCLRGEHFLLSGYWRQAESHRRDAEIAEVGEGATRPEGSGRGLWGGWPGPADPLGLSHRGLQPHRRVLVRRPARACGPIRIAYARAAICADLCQSAVTHLVRPRRTLRLCGAIFWMRRHGEAHAI